MVRVTSAPPPEERANLEGRVTGLFGIPIAGARVSLDDTSTYTDKTGRYVFEKIKLGTWTLKVESPTWLYTDVERIISMTKPKTYVLNVTLPLSLQAKAAILGSLSTLIGGALILTRRR